MKSIGVLGIATLVVVLSGCATTFQPKGATGGYSYTALAPNVYEIYFHGNGYTSEERAKDFALLEAADITLSNGFEYFQIAAGNTRTKTQAVYLPQYSTTTASAYGSDGYAYGTAHTTTYGGFPMVFHKPVVDITVTMHHNKPADGLSFDAAFLKRSLDAKYAIKD